MTDRRYLTQREKAELMLRQNGKCAGCGCRLMAGLFEHDHICDLQFEGDNALDNWQILCTSGNRCHQAKTRAASKASAKAERIARQAYGERSGTAKLNADQVRQIRNDPRTQRRIAVDYGICKSTVGYIKRGEYWSNDR